jgi:class 3 adenylate cyclase
VCGDLPTGTVTFLFTDVEGSTKLLRELGPDAYARELARHRDVVREACSPARAAGRALSLEEAVGYALGSVD